MKQLFDAQEAGSNPSSLTAVTPAAATETNLWTPAVWTPLNAPSGGWQAPAVFKLEASGLVTLAATPGTVALTARIGTSATPGSNTICGAASTAETGTTAAGVKWWLDAIVTIRSIGLPGANSIVFVNGKFHCPKGFQAAGVAGTIVFGGVTVGLDLSVAQALAISATCSVNTTPFTLEQISWYSRSN